MGSDQRIRQATAHRIIAVSSQSEAALSTVAAKLGVHALVQVSLRVVWGPSVFFLEKRRVFVALFQAARAILADQK
ncbi:MAG TPA: hypothetical protein DCY79_11035 [Planctomycetaceae bacterium]|nr:hypothetical protein [Planctomycetaceae bacterium]